MNNKERFPNEWQNELFELIRYTSYEEHGIRECAEYIKNMLISLDLDVRISKNSGAPSIMARTKGVFEKIILLYSHYDVKPVRNPELWESEPFEPTIREGRIYARGTGDAKGQLFAAIKAIEKLREKNVINSKVGLALLFEGEEESGSTSLKEICRDNKEFLKNDMIIVLDSHWVGESPVVSYGSRGQISLILSSKEKNMEGSLHAGNYGGIHVGAAQKMIKAIAEFYDGKHVNLPVFYENIEEDDFGPFGPVFSVCAINGGTIRRSLIPHECKALVDIRLICNQNNDKIIEAIKKFFNEREIHVKVRQVAKPIKTKAKENHIKILKESIEQAFKKNTMVLPYIGAYIPLEPLLELGEHIYVVPIAQSDENNHAPNENIILEHIVRGIDMIISIYEKSCCE